SKQLLLLQKVEGGGGGGFGLECQVHALMAAVLLRLAGADPLQTDAEPQPPNGELRQSEQGLGAGEGCSVVGAHCAGQAELLEDPLEGRSAARRVGEEG